MHSKNSVGPKVNVYFWEQLQKEKKLDAHRLEVCVTSIFFRFRKLLLNVLVANETNLIFCSYFSGVHPDQPLDSFTLKNDRSCTFHGIFDGITSHIPTKVESETIKKFATLTVENGSPYESLQWTLTGTNHTQNEVLARQSECPQSLTLCEFINFGSLRADGHRLQLRKLYAMIETESLAFETVSVQGLIMQTLWEVGPSNPLADQWNESHEDFTDPKFAGAMIDLIDKFINTQKCNWKHPLKLMMTASIGVRVFELNDDEDVADRIVQLLVKLRDIAYDWMSKVQTAMHEAAGIQADVEKIRMNLVEIAIAGMLSVVQCVCVKKINFIFF